MFAVAQVHLKRNPPIVLPNGHPPRASYVIRELPQDVVPVLIRKTLAVRLNDRVATRPDGLANDAE
jgi:hypothetical protein